MDPDSHAGGGDRLQVDDVSEVGDIRGDVVIAMNIGRFARPLIRDAFYSSQTVFEKAVRGALDGPRNAGVRRAAIGRVMFEAAILGRRAVRRDHETFANTRAA